jgi:hypothetical protein
MRGGTRRGGLANHLASIRAGQITIYRNPDAESIKQNNQRVVTQGPERLGEKSLILETFAVNQFLAPSEIPLGTGYILHDLSFERLR